MQRINDPCQATRDLDLLSTEKDCTGTDAGHIPKPFIALPSFPPLRRQLEFVSLPAEILAETFAYLDFSSVLAVKLTCKTFYYVTKTRQFWRSRISTLAQLHYICPPEDELDNYTVNELEQWALRRARALDVFTSSRKPHFRKRTVDLRPAGLSELRSSNFILIPGGRWLLIRHPSAIVYYMDLDSPEPILRTLFDPHEIDNQIGESKSTIFSTWIDKASPRLSFRLALLVRTKDVFRTCTSQIDMVDHGMDATLVASSVAMLRNFNSDLWAAGLTLNDRYLVQVWCTESMAAQIGIHNYGLALGCPDYPMNHDSDHPFNVATPGMMEFIYDDIFIIQSIKSPSLSIFEVESSSSLKLLHRIEMLAYPWSMPRWTPEATVITMVNRRSPDIQGLIIPHDTSHPPTNVELGSYTVMPHLCVLGTWLLVTRGIQHKVFRYGWDLDAPAKQPSALACIFEEEFSSILTFDEDTGRFLGYPPFHLDIIDIV